MEFPIKVGFHLMCLNTKSSSETTPNGLEILHRSNQGMPAWCNVGTTPNNPSCIISNQAWTDTFYGTHPANNYSL